MKFIVPSPTGVSSQATHKLMGRGISAFAILLLLQAASQIVSQARWTAIWWEATFMWGFLCVLAIFIVASFRGRGLVWSAGVLSGLVLFGLLLWPLAVPSSVPPEIGAPWLWAMINVGAVCCTFAFGSAIGCVYTLFIGAAFAAIRTMPQAGAASMQVALEDAAFATVMGLIICVTIGILRHAAQRVDDAADEAIVHYRDAASETALSNERLRLDALLHDSVMTALITAALSGSPQERNASAELAASALQRLEQLDGPSPIPTPASVSELAARIRFTVDDGAENPKVTVSWDIPKHLVLPGDVVRAVFEATTEAVRNATRHSGAAQCQVLVSSRSISDSARVEVSIRDDGKGFYPAAVADRRLGIKVSIVGRLNAVGGSAFINSTPGLGTEVRLLWNGATT